MGTPRRSDILSNVQSVLSGITTGNGYKTTVHTVGAVVKEWASVGAQELPWVGVKPGKETFEHQPFGVLIVTLPIEIVCIVAAANDTARYSALGNLIDDVIAALSADTTRGGYAISTSLAEDETDEGDPDTQNSGGGTGAMVVRVSVRYERTIAKS